MYRTFMTKIVKTKKDLNYILGVMKWNRIHPYFSCNGDIICYENNKWYRLYHEDEVIDVKTLLKEGLVIKANVGSRKNGATKKYDVCTELGFMIVNEGEW